MEEGVEQNFESEIEVFSWQQIIKFAFCQLGQEIRFKIFLLI